MSISYSDSSQARRLFCEPIEIVAAGNYTIGMDDLFRAIWVMGRTIGWSGDGG